MTPDNIGLCNDNNMALQRYAAAQHCHHFSLLFSLSIALAFNPRDLYHQQ